MIFDHERHRVELALILHLAGITGNRPAALALTHETARVTVLQVGGQPRFLIEVSFNNIKGYLGDIDTYILCAALVAASIMRWQLDY